MLLGPLLVATLLLTGSLPSAAASGSAAAEDLTLQVSLPDHFSGCDPVGGTVNPSTLQALSLVLPEAFVTDQDGIVQQAESFLRQAEVQSLNPLVVAYSILPNAQWIDGRAIGLSDFVATWHWGARGTGPAASQYRAIKSIKMGSTRNSVLVQFATPTSDWRTLFSPLLPSTAPFRSIGSCDSPSSVIDLSGGPYVIVSSSSTEIILIKNPRWWGPPTPFTFVNLGGGSDPVPGQFSGFDSFGLGEVDWLSTQGLDGLTSAPGVSSEVDLSNQIVSLDFNTSKHGNVPVLVRQALAHLIDRTAIINETVAPFDTLITPAASYLLAQGQPDYPSRDASSAAQSYYPRKSTLSSSNAMLARRLLERAGYSRSDGNWVDASGDPLSLTMAFPQDDHVATQISELVKAQLGKAGIAVKSTGLSSSPDVATALREGRAKLGVIVRPTDGYPAHSASWYTKSPGNAVSALWAGYQNKSDNSLAVTASENMNPTNALPLYRQLDSQLWSAVPSLPILTDSTILAWSSSLDGVVNNSYPPGTLSLILTWKVLAPAG
jgi:peptide/nickel transport system substrate-binding protein